MSKTFENDFFWSSSLDCCFQNLLAKKNTKKNMDNIDPPPPPPKKKKKSQYRHKKLSYLLKTIISIHF